MKMMLWKEWRELIRWAPLPLIAFSLAIYSILPGPGIRYNNFISELSVAVAMTGAVTAILMALLQTLPESRSDSRGLLLSRPVSRKQIFAAKTIVAATIYGLCLGIPLLYTTFWVMMVAPETRPMQPVQVLAGLIVGVSCFACHPATCWMVSRPARWVGTRTLPLVAAIVPMVFSFAAVESSRTWSVLLVWISVIGVLIALAYLSARHAFVRLSNLPPSSRKGSVFKPAALMLVVCCVIVVSTIGVATITNIPSLQPQYGMTGQSSLRVDEEGTVYDALVRQEFDTPSGAYRNIVEAAAPAIENNGSGDPAPKPPSYSGGHLESFVQFSPLLNQTQSVLNPYQHWGYNQFGTYESIYHRDGYYLLYDRHHKKLRGYLTRSGAGEMGEKFDGPSPVMFASSTLGTTSLLVDRGGVYQVSRDGTTVRTLMKQQIDGVGWMYVDEGTNQLWIQSGAKLIAYDVTSAEGLTPEASEPDPSPEIAQYMSNRPVDLTKTRELSLESDPEAQVSIAKAGDLFVVAESNGFNHYTIHKFNNENVRVSSTLIVTHFQRYDVIDSNMLVTAGFPPVAAMIAEAFAHANGAFDLGIPMVRQSPRVNAVIWTLVVIHMVIALALTIIACRQRRLSRNATIGWSITSLLLGLANVLAIYVLYAKQASCVCGSCDERMRVDQSRCPACGADWDAPVRDGCEIFESEKAPAPTPVAV